MAVNWRDPRSTRLQETSSSAISQPPQLDPAKMPIQRQARAAVQPQQAVSPVTDMLRKYGGQIADYTRRMAGSPTGQLLGRAGDVVGKLAERTETPAPLVGSTSGEYASGGQWINPTTGVRTPIQAAGAPAGGVPNYADLQDRAVTELLARLGGQMTPEQRRSANDQATRDYAAAERRMAASGFSAQSPLMAEYARNIESQRNAALADVQGQAQQTALQQLIALSQQQKASDLDWRRMSADEKYRYTALQQGQQQSEQERLLKQQMASEQSDDAFWAELIKLAGPAAGSLFGPAGTAIGGAAGNWLGNLFK